MTNKWNKIEVANPPSERMHHGCVLYKNSMWIYGGRTPEMEGLDDLYRFDLRTLLYFIADHFHFTNKIKQERWCGVRSTLRELFLPLDGAIPSLFQEIK